MSMNTGDFLDAFKKFLQEEYDLANPGTSQTVKRSRNRQPPIHCCGNTCYRYGAALRPARKRKAGLADYPAASTTTEKAEKTGETQPPGIVASTSSRLPSLPIPVEIEPGHVVDVPRFAAHVSRQYKTRLGGIRWHI